MITESYKEDFAMRHKNVFWCLLLMCALLLSGCSSNPGNTEASTENTLSKIDMTKWQYEEEADVYWQTGIVYCASPADEEYENLGIYVPGAYMTGTENGDGTYTCEINTAGTVSGFTAETAPMVLPVDTPGYVAMAAPTGYDSGTTAYTDAGFVYVYAGCRGRDTGAPAGVTDLKAAIRYVRYIDELIPGNTDRIFTFGMSGGGAQSALLGATATASFTPPIWNPSAQSAASATRFSAPWPGARSQTWTMPAKPMNGTWALRGRI